MTKGGRQELLDALATELGPAAVLRDRDAVARVLRDNSWLSPILSEHFEQRKQDSEGGLVADAVVTPADIDQLRTTISLAVRHDTPMTLRGGGTTNFGQSLPLHGGIVIDVRKLDRILEVADASATAEGGALQGDVDRAARERGREMTILPTTYASATLAGWVAGGHLGLGGTTYGTTWDGNVLGVKLLTAEEEPREIVLQGQDAVYPVLRTYGTTGVITEVTVPLVPARTWLEAVVVFDTFDAAAHYVEDLAERADIAQRSVSAQEAPLAASFTPLRHLFRKGQAIVPAVFDADHEAEVRRIAEARGGRFERWQITGEGGRFPLGYMSYGHRMLWVKKVAPPAAFLNCYLLPDAVFEQFRALKERFGDDIWLELKYNRSRWLRELRGLPGDGILPSPLLTLVPGDRAFVESVMAFCDTIGVTYQNPHTFAIEESGVFPDVERIVRFARDVDPKGLLNPGKLGGTFFSSTGARTR
jgi:FAD/FMN-containing dehydrogenase